MGFWVYILRCADNSYYTGHTDNLEKRIVEHNAGQIEGYTSGRLPVTLVFADDFPTREEALARERQIKGWNRKKKEAMMRADWAEVSRLAHAIHPHPSTGSGRTECGTLVRLKEPSLNTMKQPRIEVILYDLGNVILPFNHYQIAEKLARFSQKADFLNPRAVFSFLFDFDTGAINGYEMGKCSSRQFFLSLKETLHLSLSFEAFVPIWNDIFTEDHEVSRMILSQKGKWKLGLVSNTNSLHFDYVLSEFPVVRVFDRWILSHEVGFKKPDVGIFRKAMEWAGVEPKKILFIDDMKKHVEAARSLGMEVIHFTSASQLKEELSSYLGRTGVG